MYIQFFRQRTMKRKEIKKEQTTGHEVFFFFTENFMWCECVKYESTLNRSEIKS